MHNLGGSYTSLCSPSCALHLAPPSGPFRQLPRPDYFKSIPPFLRSGSDTHCSGWVTLIYPLKFTSLFGPPKSPVQFPPPFLEVSSLLPEVFCTSDTPSVSQDRSLQLPSLEIESQCRSAVEPQPVFSPAGPFLQLTQSLQTRLCGFSRPVSFCYCLSCLSGRRHYMLILFLKLIPSQLGERVSALRLCKSPDPGLLKKW